MLLFLVKTAQLLKQLTKMKITKSWGVFVCLFVKTTEGSMVLKVHREESCQTAHCGDAVGVSVPWLASQRTDGDDIYLHKEYVFGLFIYD